MSVDVLSRCAAGIDPYDPKAEAPHEVVSFTGSFHGRTLGALALTYKDAYKTPFSPGLPGARMVKYLDLEAAASVIQKVRVTSASQAVQVLYRAEPERLLDLACSGRARLLLYGRWLPSWTKCSRHILKPFTRCCNFTIGIRKEQ